MSDFQEMESTITSTDEEEEVKGPVSDMGSMLETETLIRAYRILRDEKRRP